MQIYISEYRVKSARNCVNKKMGENLNQNSFEDILSKMITFELSFQISVNSENLPLFISLCVVNFYTVQLYSFFHLFDFHTQKKPRKLYYSYVLSFFLSKFFKNWFQFLKNICEKGTITVQDICQFCLWGV